MSSSAESSTNPETWYRESYAPLWAENPADHIEQILDHYATNIWTHGDNGEITQHETDAWLRAPMQEWLADGWINATLQRLEANPINTTTASFKADWLDHYKEAPEEHDCGWYLADYLDGKWQITTYAGISCDSF
jgi:hypothetical protein